MSSGSEPGFHRILYDAVQERVAVAAFAIVSLCRAEYGGGTTFVEIDALLSEAVALKDESRARNSDEQLDFAYIELSHMTENLIGLLWKRYVEPNFNGASGSTADEGAA